MRVYPWGRGLVCLQAAARRFSLSPHIFSAAFPQDMEACSSKPAFWDAVRGLPVSRRTNITFSWFCTTGSVCYQFLVPHFLRGRRSEFGWQVRILEFPSHSKPLLQGKAMGIAAWPLISAAFSFNPFYKKLDGEVVLPLLALCDILWETSSGWAWLGLGCLNSFLCFPLQLPKPCYASSNGKLDFLVSLV